MALRPDAPASTGPGHDPGAGTAPAAALPATERERVLERLARERFDLLVIGGGISGAGIAREAALRGASVALVEADDYASGTSSRSSKLIHGGLRYLALGDVALVRKTALERKHLHRLAPHLAEPRWMLVPVRSRAALLKFRTAIGAYEKLGAVEGPDRHQSWSGERLEREEPLLDRERTPWACAYREYLTDDAHLVLANLRDAAGRGAAVASRARVEGFALEGGRAVAAKVRCGLSDRVLVVRARAIVNAAGPWVESLQRLERPDAPPLLHLSKGVHVVVPAERLPVRHMLVLQTADKRSVFAIRRDDGVYIGTTDTSYTADERTWPAIRREDVEYLLEPVPRHLDTAPLRPDEVVGAWAGLRPLIAEPGRAPTEISRRDEVSVGPAGVVTLAGGKLTGYRPTARTTLERAAAEAGLAIGPAPEDEPPLPGGDFAATLDALAADVAAEAKLDAATAARLVRLYGSEAHAVAAGDVTPLVPHAPVLAGEVDWAVTHEGALGVVDVLYRRLRTALYVPRAREAAVVPVATRMAARLGWDAARRDAEVEAARRRLASDLAFLEEDSP